MDDEALRTVASCTGKMLSLGLSVSRGDVSVWPMDVGFAVERKEPGYYESFDTADAASQAFVRLLRA